jgi:hypothetical protein
MFRATLHDGTDHFSFAIHDGMELEFLAKTYSSTDSSSRLIKLELSAFYSEKVSKGERILRNVDPAGKAARGCSRDL